MDQIVLAYFIDSVILFMGWYTFIAKELKTLWGWANILKYLILVNGTFLFSPWLKTAFTTTILSAHNCLEHTVYYLYN
jgi:hypothetical protein